MNDVKQICKVVELDNNDILPNRFQPRKYFDEEEILQLSESIKEHGVLSPIIVRQLGDKYELVAGERRYKANILAGNDSIPAIIMDLNDKESSEIAVVENIQRKDLNPVEEAISYKRILDIGYMTQEQLAQKMGKSQSSIANKIRLLKLSDNVQDALMKKQISERHARSLLKLDSMSQQNDLLKRIINERLTVRKTDEEIEKMNNNMNTSLDDIFNATSVNNVNTNNIINNMNNQNYNGNNVNNIYANQQPKQMPNDIFKESNDNGNNVNLQPNFDFVSPNNVERIDEKPETQQFEEIAPIMPDNLIRDVNISSIPGISNNNINNENSNNLFPESLNSMNNNINNVSIENNLSGSNVSNNNIDDLEELIGDNDLLNNQYNNNFNNNNTVSNDLYNLNIENNQPQFNQELPKQNIEIPVNNFSDIIGNNDNRNVRNNVIEPSRQTIPVIDNNESFNNIQGNKYNNNNSLFQSAPIIDTTIKSNNISDVSSFNAEENLIEENIPNKQYFQETKPEPIIVNDYNQQYDPIMPDKKNVAPTVEFKDILSLIRKCSAAIENSGYKIETEEYNLDNLYQVVFKIEKK